jgi:predicted RNase H-like HicB family nuclease
MSGSYRIQEVINMRNLTAFIEKDPETGLYVGIIPGLPGAHTQGETLDELQRNLKEVVELCLDEMSQEEKEKIPEFVGTQQVEAAL